MDLLASAAAAAAVNNDNDSADANANANANANAGDDDNDDDGSAAVVAATVDVESKSKFNNRNLKNQLRPEDLLVSIPIGHPDSMMSKESVRRAVEDFITTPTDIIVSTFPKTGTTLITWICHLLRTISMSHHYTNKEKNNNEIEILKLTIMNSFDTIYELCPWPTLCWDIGDDPNKNNNRQGNQLPLPPPRVYKSHLRMASIYKGCKYIVTVRDPSKTTLSFYNFFISKKVPFIIDTTTGKDNKILMDVSTFLLKTPFIQGSIHNTNDAGEPNNQRASIWDYYIEYHQLLTCSDVLILIYEDMVQDMPQAIRQIGQFMNILNNDNDSDNDDGNGNDNDDDNLISIIGSMTTKEYMSNYMSKFDEPYERACQLNRSADLSQLAPGNKISIKVQQKHHHPQILNEEAQQFLSKKWKESLQPLGYNNYNDDFCTTIRNRNKKLFGG